MGQVYYGPDNPHPLSTMRTELIWEGKYDEFGNRRQVDIAGAAMPLQKIETIDEPRSVQSRKGGSLKSRRRTATTSATCSSGGITSW